MSPNIQCLERAPAPTPTSRLNLITFVSFPPSANNESPASHSHNHEYFIQTLTQKTQIIPHPRDIDWPPLSLCGY